MSRVGLADVRAALRAAGWDAHERAGSSDPYLVVPVADDSDAAHDDPAAEASLAEISALVLPLGYEASWLGSSDTDASGETTSDVIVAPIEADA